MNDLKKLLAKRLAKKGHFSFEKQVRMADAAKKYFEQGY